MLHMQPLQPSHRTCVSRAVGLRAQASHCTHTHTRTHARMHAHMRVCVCVFVCVCACVWMLVSLHWLSVAWLEWRGWYLYLTGRLCALWSLLAASDAAEDFPAAAAATITPLPGPRPSSLEPPRLRLSCWEGPPHGSRRLPLRLFTSGTGTLPPAAAAATNAPPPRLRPSGWRVEALVVLVVVVVVVLVLDGEVVRGSSLADWHVLVDLLIRGSSCTAR